MKPDGDFFVGFASLVIIIIAIVVGILTGMRLEYNSQLEFTRICVAGHKSVVYREINANTVSECK